MNGIGCLARARMPWAVMVAVVLAAPAKQTEAGEDQGGREGEDDK
jgi:hypothetical protein